MSNPLPNSETFLGKIQTRIAGMQYVDGMVRPGETVHLERDRHNSHDANAIRVKNIGFENAGFISRELAMWLAPLMDEGRVYANGLVPVNWDLQPGWKRAEGCPLELSLILADKGAYLLEKKESLASEQDLLQEVILSLYESLPRCQNAGIVRSVQERLLPLIRRAALPETTMLLHLFEHKAREMECSRSNGKLSKIRESLLKLPLGAPIHAHNLTLHPILQPEGSRSRHVLLKTALEQGWAEVEEVSHSGSVNELRLRNDGDMPILVPEGEILSGAKQNRVINITILVAAKCTVVVPVSCVERGRWRYTSQHFQSTHFAPPKLRRRKMESVHRSRKATGMPQSDQSAVWDEVNSCLHTLEAPSSTDSITDGYAKEKDRLDDYRSRLKLPEQTAGVIISSGNEIIGIDYFATPEMFQQCWERICDSYFIEAAQDERPCPTASTEPALEFLHKVSENVQLADRAVGIGDELMIDSQEITGVGLWYEDSLCQLSAFHRKNNE